MAILIISPLEDEFNAVIETMNDHGLPTSETTVGRLNLRASNDGALLIAQGGLGKAQFALQTQHLLDRLGEIDLVVCAGTAGCLVDGLGPGDVVIGTETVEHDFNKKIFKSPQPRFAGHDASVRALRDRESGARFPFNVRFGPIASGDEAIVDSARRREVHDATGALAVAWEGAGCARACSFSDVPFLEIRGVSDLADDSAIDEFARNLPVAMRNVALITMLLGQH